MIKLEVVKQNFRDARTELVCAIVELERGRGAGVIFIKTIEALKQTIGDLYVAESVLELYFKAEGEP